MARSPQEPLCDAQRQQDDVEGEVELEALHPQLEVDACRDGTQAVRTCARTLVAPRVARKCARSRGSGSAFEARILLVARDLENADARKARKFVSDRRSRQPSLQGNTLIPF